MHSQPDSAYFLPWKIENIQIPAMNAEIQTRKGWCPRTGKGQQFVGKEAVNGNLRGYWVWKRLMSQLCWQHAKIISPNKNPPERSKGVINVNS